jgi:excinuclease ABC subunit C
LLIDGGRGQLNIAREVLEKLEIKNVILLSIAKDPGRRRGKDVIYRLADHNVVIVMLDKPARHLLEEIRDETHRFAVSSHRQRFIKKRHVSVLENIPGIGPGKAKILLQHFGGLQEIKEADLLALQKVPGLNPKLAQSIYDYFHQ